jgi:hypothetical protein
MNSQIAMREAHLRTGGWKRHRPALLALAVACAAVVLGCGCSGPAVPVTMATTPAHAPTSGASSSAGMVAVGETFRNGSFEVTVTEVTTGVKKYIKGLSVAPVTSRNGQLIAVRMTAKNVSMAPAQFGSDHHRMVDTRGRRFGPTQVRGFEYHARLNPDQTTQGVVIFDVAAGVDLGHLIVQTDDNGVGQQSRTYVAAPKP